MRPETHYAKSHLCPLYGRAYDVVDECFIDSTVIINGRSAIIIEAGHSVPADEQRRRIAEGIE